jgi:signal transduction histidine kinase/ligand-binding sensor domain-containing protein
MGFLSASKEADFLVVPGQNQRATSCAETPVRSEIGYDVDAMGISGRRPRYLALGAVLGGMLLAACPCVFALDPSLDVSQYAHTTWKIRDGVFTGSIQAIAQTPDGYLWLGTPFGLLRFDGIRAVPWQPPQGQSLSFTDIRALLSARDGTLWIGGAKGLASWKNGKLTHYPELAQFIILRLLEDRQGTIWAGAYGVPAGRLCAVQKDGAQCYGEDGHLGPAVVSLLEDSKGNLWAGVQKGIWRWKPGPPKFYPLPGEVNGFLALTEHTDGALLVGWKGGVYKFTDGKTEAYPLTGTAHVFQTRSLFYDRDGGLWIGTDRGLVHVHKGKTDVFGLPDGLSGDLADAVFEDREGDVWVTTLGGLDRFRDFAVTTLSVTQGLSHTLVGSVLAARDGSIWLGTVGGLNKWFDGKISHFGKRDGKINGHAPNSLFQDSRGRIWVATFYQFGFLENEAFVSINGLPAGNIHGIGEDSEGNLWIASKEFGLFRLSQRREIQRFSWDNLKPRDYAEALVADPLQGGLWLGFSGGGVAYFADGQVRRIYTTTDGLGEGWVAHLRFDSDGTLWAATEGGLSRLKNGHIATLASKNGLPCDTVHWSKEDVDGSLWLYMTCGLVRIHGDELDKWIAAAENDKDTKTMIRATVFDISDGVTIHGSGGYSPLVAESRDGRLWFLPFDGVSIVDPRHLPFNNLPPPVHIEQIIADHKTYAVASEVNGSVRLPPLLRDLRIDYTAISLVAPEKVLFRYKLEGWDRDWQDVGTRRQAFYSNLPPSNYRFRVMACNNSGVWNEVGTSLDFFVAPAYYQTWWFRLSCVTGFLGLLAVFHRLRLHQQAKRFNVTLEARVSERTRIARELHDTLLQSFQGVLLKFHAVSYMMNDRPDEQKALEAVIDQAQQAISEGRDAVQGLRSSTMAGNELARAIKLLGEEFAADHGGNHCPDFRVSVEGTTRDLAPILRDETYRILSEAVRNAFRHAQARRIEVEIQYGQRELRLRVRDDGKGIEPNVLSAGARAGHYGLPGMHERVKVVGGKLSVWSELDSGTEVELTIPGSLAYAKSSRTG